MGLPHAVAAELLAHEPLEQAAARTESAMRAGVDVIDQGVFAHGDWHGIADFLVRVETPSALGAWGYEAWDAKLARHARPYFVLQLCFYSSQLERLAQPLAKNGYGQYLQRLLNDKVY